MSFFPSSLRVWLFRAHTLNATPGLWGVLTRERTILTRVGAELSCERLEKSLAATIGPMCGTGARAAGAGAAAAAASVGGRGARRWRPGGAAQLSRMHPGAAAGTRPLASSPHPSCAAGDVVRAAVRVANTVAVKQPRRCRISRRTAAHRAEGVSAWGLFARLGRFFYRRTPRVITQEALASID